MERVERDEVDAKKDQGVLHESASGAKRRAMDKLKKNVKEGFAVRAFGEREGSDGIERCRTERICWFWVCTVMHMAVALAVV